MSNFHQTIVQGYVGGKPEIRSLKSGKSVANFSIAVTERWKDKDDEDQERTEWYRCAAFGKTADVVERYVKKGQLLLVVGRLQTDKVEDGDETKYFTKLNIDQLKLPPKGTSKSRDDDDDSDDDDEPRRKRSSKSNEKRRARDDDDDEPRRRKGAEDFDDDIPF